MNWRKIGSQIVNGLMGFVAATLLASAIVMSVLELLR